MQSKLRQLVISALMRNHHTLNLDIKISMSGYDVTVYGEVPSDFYRAEVIETIESVSPCLRVDAQMTLVDVESELEYAAKKELQFA